MKYYAHLQLKRGTWIITSSIIGRKLDATDYKVTVKKTLKGLYWQSAGMYIPIDLIEEVIDGDITEYLL